MNEPFPTMAEWQQLYDLIPEIKKLAPWTFMNEDMVFGVQNPDTSEYGFVSIMGSLGEHLAIAVYLGTEALYSFWAIQHDEVEPESILEVQQLQASFEDREMVTSEDRKVMNTLGRKFRGRQSWPVFRSYRPGFVPWYLTQDEAKFLVHVLTQVLDVAPRVRENPNLLPPLDDEFSYLIRMPIMEGETLLWQDQIMQVHPPKSRKINIMLDIEALAFVKNLPLSKSSLEVDFFMTPAQIQEQKGQRPFFAYSLLAVEHKSGFIIGGQTLSADPTMDDMLGQVALKLLYILANASLRPKTIFVQSARIHGLISPLCQELGIRIKTSSYLRELEIAKASLLDFMNR